MGRGTKHRSKTIIFLCYFLVIFPDLLSTSITFPGLLCPSVQFSSAAQSCPTLCDSMNHSIAGLPVVSCKSNVISQFSISRLFQTINSMRAETLTLFFILPLSVSGTVSSRISTHLMFLEYVNFQNNQHTVFSFHKLVKNIASKKIH